MNPNNTGDRAQLTADVERLAAELNQARADVVTLRRLKDAEADEKRLTVELRVAQEQLAERNAADVIAQRDAAYANYIDIGVEEEITLSGDSIMHNIYRITVTQREWNGWENAPKVIVFDSFRALPGEAFNYLLEKHPSRIPAKIMALNPLDAWDAFSIYFSGLKRGYFTGPSE